jgi:hypothetical protein
LLIINPSKAGENQNKNDLQIREEMAEWLSNEELESE